MPLPDTAYTELRDGYRTCKILNGMWQVSGAHGKIDPAAALDSMRKYHDAGFTTWDLADHYGPAEDIIGLFRTALASEKSNAELSNVQAFTKWVPRPGSMHRAKVEKAINVSLKRMQVDQLDMLQFHWWDYGNDAYLDALRHMADMIDEGMIKFLSLTNFDTKRLEIILNHGIDIVSNQVQFSVVDRRPEQLMAPFAEKHGVKLFTYGSICGGLISERYLGAPEPGFSKLNTASLRKYKNMIDAWGGWALFQQLLKELSSIAKAHHVQIPQVAAKYILEKSAVAGVIIGVRLGIKDHFKENQQIFSFEIEHDEIERIDAITRQANDLMKIIGDCGDEYR